MSGEPPNNRILITGGSGQVGGALTRILAPLGDVLAPTREQLDLTDMQSIRTVMHRVRPRWVVNAAAYTAVDKAESEPELAFAINSAAPEVLAEEAMSIGATLIHFSTDYVFDGSKATPYVESDSTNPLSIYGQSKLAGEKALSASRVPFIVFRTSWVYGATGNNFLRTILRVARERDHLRIVADQHGAPTWSSDLARMTAHVIARVEQRAAETKSSLCETTLSVSGIYHASGAGETTWHGFAAQALGELQRADPDCKLATLEPISTAEYPTAAKRPLNSLLDCSKLERVFQWRMPDWRDSLALVLACLAKG
jgi:dTDP-4-dehydrorhamnose reductase